MSGEQAAEMKAIRDEVGAPIVFLIGGLSGAIVGFVIGWLAAAMLGT